MLLSRVYLGRLKFVQARLTLGTREKIYRIEVNSRNIRLFTFLVSTFNLHFSINALGIDAINKCFVDRPDLMQTDGLSAAACWLYSKEAVNE